MMDSILIAAILLAALYGLFRGIVSQASGLLGIVLAYVFASSASDFFAIELQKLLNLSTFVAQKFSVLVAGTGIYLLCRIAGLLVEKLVVARVQEFKRLNRFGGACLGAVKMFIIIFVALSFLAILPQKSVESALPATKSSRVYALVQGHNPFADKHTLKGYQSMRTAVQKPKTWKKLKDEKEMHKILDSHGLEQLLEQETFVKKLKSGDLAKLTENYQVEEMMRDDDLIELIERLEQEEGH